MSVNKGEQSDGLAGISKEIKEKTIESNNPNHRYNNPNHRYHYFQSNNPNLSDLQRTLRFVSIGCRITVREESNDEL